MAFMALYISVYLQQNSRFKPAARLSAAVAAAAAGIALAHAVWADWQATLVP